MTFLIRPLPLLLASVVLLGAFAGCLGSEDVERALPAAVVTVTPVDEGLGEDDLVDTFVFDASASTGVGLRFDWSFGDGTMSDRPTVTHTYVYGTDTYRAELLVTDAYGVTVRWHDDIVVGSGLNHPPVALFTPSTRYLEVGEPLTVDARASHDPDGDGIVYEWDFNHLPMDTETYYHFREQKANGAATEDDDGAVVDEGKAGRDLPRHLQEWVASVKDLFYKHGPDEGNEPPASLFDGRRSTTDPVYTLQDGFPEPTRFYVRLTAVDTKGASEAIVSEEIWPVEVVSSKIPEVYEDERSGTFTHGAPDAVGDEMPESENVPLDDRDEWPFEIPGVLKDLGLDDAGKRIPAMWVNVTWTQNPVHATAGVYANQVDLELAAPSGDVFTVAGDGAITYGITSDKEVGEGAWSARFFARQGVDIEWTITYWAIIDLNPFRELEAGFV